VIWLEDSSRYGGVMRVLLALILTLVFQAPVAAENWRDVDLGSGVREGVATQEDIWLLGLSGKVVHFARRTGERRVVATDVQDMLSDGRRLWVLARQDNAASYLLHDLRSGSPTPTQMHGNPFRVYLHSSEDGVGAPIGLVAQAGQERPAILTQNAFVIPTETSWKRQPLAATLSRWGHVAAAQGGDVYVGYNRGEWGGGLRRITSAGAVSFVKGDGDELCEGTINPACSPIIGVYRDPGMPDCVMVGTGLAHLGMSHGNIYRVCGDAISPVFSTPVPTEPDRWMMGPQPWPLDEFVEVPKGWIGLSRDRYFRSRDGNVTEHPMPTFHNWSGIKISEEQDDVLFVVSACCWGSVDNPTLYHTIAIPIAP